MKVLALEFSSPQRSIALLDWDGTVTQVLGELLERDFRRTTPLAQIDQLLKSSGIAPKDIECIAVGLGPGSYTGIRSALAIAQGWQFVRAVKVCGASSSEALAFAASQQGMRGHIQTIIDAQRQELYVEDFQLDDKFKSITPLRIEPVEKWKSTSAPIVLGPEIHRWDQSGQALFPTALAVAELALPKAQFVPAETLEPIYLRAATFVKAPPPRVLPPN